MTVLTIKKKSGRFVRACACFSHCAFIRRLLCTQRKIVFYFLINRFIWDCILLVLPNKAVNFLFAQNLRHWVLLWFIDNTSDSGVLYWFVQRLINLPNGYERNEKKVLFWSFSIRTSIFLGNILLVLLDWNCQNEYHHDQVTLHLSAKGCNKF